MIPGISKRYFRIFFLIKLPHKKNPELKNSSGFFYDLSSTYKCNFLGADNKQ